MAYQIFKPISQVQGVLFDMDGVILDSEGLYTRFWQEAALSLGYPMTHAQAIGMRGLNRGAAAANWKAILVRALTISKCGTNELNGWMPM